MKFEKIIFKDNTGKARKKILNLKSTVKFIAKILVVLKPNRLDRHVWEPEKDLFLIAIKNEMNTDLTIPSLVFYIKNISIQSVSINPNRNHLNFYDINRDINLFIYLNWNKPSNIFYLLTKFMITLHRQMRSVFVIYLDFYCTLPLETLEVLELLYGHL